ncbi:hypothetical protein [Thioclava sp. GXIMD2076]|uniref:XRE family transcriptional regulator n=1 Tax=Thioclava kandeliae TaxID=3070818 RepID=A0ABV1SFU1_9RHOB
MRIGISMRQASLKAGKSPGYLHSVLKDGNDPTVSSLTEICQTNGLNFPYIVFGVHIDDDVEELLRLSHRHPALRNALLTLLRSGQPDAASGGTETPRTARQVKA